MELNKTHTKCATLSVGDVGMRVVVIAIIHLTPSARYNVKEKAIRYQRSLCNYLQRGGYPYDRGGFLTTSNPLIPSDNHIGKGRGKGKHSTPRVQ